MRPCRSAPFGMFGVHTDLTVQYQTVKRFSLAFELTLRARHTGQHYNTTLYASMYLSMADARKGAPTRHDSGQAQKATLIFNRIQDDQPRWLLGRLLSNKRLCWCDGLPGRLRGWPRSSLMVLGLSLTLR